MSEKRMVYAEDVIQRIRDLAPEILGGWYNPDMENEVEQLVCVVENTQTAAAADAQRWRYTAEEPPKEEDGDCCGWNQTEACCGWTEPLSGNLPVIACMKSLRLTAHRTTWKPKPA